MKKGWAEVIIGKKKGNIVGAPSKARAPNMGGTTKVGVQSFKWGQKKNLLLRSV